VLHRQLPLQGRRVAVVLTGGNIDVTLMARIIERGLVKTRRMTRIALIAPDVAGALGRVAQLVGATRANIVQIGHDRAFSSAELGETRMELVLETFGAEHAEEVERALLNAGYQIEPG